MGTLGSEEFSQMVKSTGYFVDFNHCPPMMGVATTFGTGPEPHFSAPSGVSTLRVFIASATLFLSLGLPLALRTAAATSKSARLAPSCWFHCFLVEFWKPSARSLELTPVRDDL